MLDEEFEEYEKNWIAKVICEIRVNVGLQVKICLVRLAPGVPISTLKQGDVGVRVSSLN